LQGSISLWQTYGVGRNNPSVVIPVVGHQGDYRGATPTIQGSPVKCTQTITEISLEGGHLAWGESKILI